MGFRGFGVQGTIDQVRLDLQQTDDFGKALSQEIADLTQKCEDQNLTVKTELDHKCDDRDIAYVKAQLPRFALYDDYKSLHDKVVPPVAQFHSVCSQVETKVMQFEEILKNYDENLHLRATKVDLSEIEIRLASYVKGN